MNAEIEKAFLFVLCFFFFFAFSAYALEVTEKTKLPIGSGDMYFTHFPDIQRQAIGGNSTYHAPAFSVFVGRSYAFLEPFMQGYVSLAQYVDLCVVFILAVVVPFLVWLYCRKNVLGVLAYFFGTGILTFHLYSSTWAQALFLVWFLLFFVVPNFWFRIFLVFSAQFVHVQGVLYLAAFFTAGLLWQLAEKHFRLFFPMAFAGKCSEWPVLQNWACSWQYFALMFSPFFAGVAVLHAARQKYEAEFWFALLFALAGTFFDVRAYIMASLLLLRPLADLARQEKGKIVYWGIAAYCILFFTLNISMFLKTTDAIVAGALAG